MAKANGKTGGKADGKARGKTGRGSARGRKTRRSGSGSNLPGEDDASEMFQTYPDRTVTVTTTMRVRRTSMANGPIEYRAQRTRIEMAIDDGVLPGTKAKVLDFGVEGPVSDSYDGVDGAILDTLAGTHNLLTELSIQSAADKSAFRDAARGRERKVRS